MMISIEEISHKLLLITGRLSHHLDSEGSQLVLVGRKAKLCPVEGRVFTIQGLDPVVHLGLIATLLLYFLGYKIR